MNNRLVAILAGILAIDAFAFAYDPSDIIATYAGSGMPGYGGDGGPAASALLNAPHNIVFDAAGNMYVSEFGNHTVRKVTPSGLISTVAGTGTSGFNGDNIQAASAQLSYPQGLAMDAAGDLYIADAVNARIRKITMSTGIITTFAGTGVAGCSNGTGVPTSAMLSNPTGLALDGAGNLFIADTNNHDIRKISANGGISTFAGACNSGFNYVEGLATDPSGNVYVADANSNEIFKITAAGVLTLYSGSSGGTAGYSGDGSLAGDLSVEFNHPETLARDGAGNLYIGDAGNHVVRVITADGIIHTAAGNHTIGNNGDGSVATSATLNYPVGVGVNAAGRLFVADGSNNSVIREIGPAAPLTVTVAGNGLGSEFIQSADQRINCTGHCGANYVVGMAVILYGNPADGDALYAWSQTGCGRSLSCTVTLTTPALKTVTARFTTWYIDTAVGISAQLDQPWGLAFDSTGNLYISEPSACLVRKRSPTGQISNVAGNGICGYFGDGLAATDAELSSPSGVATDPMGNIFVEDSANGAVRKVTPDGIIHTVTTGVVATPLGSPAIATDSFGNVYSFGAGQTITKTTPAGNSNTFATIGNSLQGFSAAPADGLVAYVISGNAAFAQRVSSSGVNAELIPWFGGVDPGYTGCLTFDASGALYGAVGNVVTQIPFRLIVGNSFYGYSGDGGPAIAAEVSQPVGIVAHDGRLYVADSGNNVVRVLYTDAIFTGDFN